MTEWVFFLDPGKESVEYIEGRECISCRYCKPLDQMVGMKCVACSSVQLCIDPHTQGVEYRVAKKCERCDEWKSHESFYEQATACRQCYDRYWSVKNESKSHWDLATHLHKTRAKANRRSRFRCAAGDPIQFADVEQLWEECKGRCAHCAVELTFEWHPRKSNKNFGVLDRIKTDGNNTYKNNAQFLCTWCNTEKGAWDLIQQQNVRIAKQKRKIRRLEKQRNKRRKKEGISYASILIQPN